MLNENRFLGTFRGHNTRTNYRFLYFSSWRKVQNESFTATYEQLPTDRKPNFFYILNQAASL
jgi:hypothetical protein